VGGIEKGGFGAILIGNDHRPYRMVRLGLSYLLNWYETSSLAADKGRSWWIVANYRLFEFPRVDSGIRYYPWAGRGCFSGRLYWMLVAMVIAIRQARDYQRSQSGRVSRRDCRCLQ
jgi:hypothetical protein